MRLLIAIQNYFTKIVNSNIKCLSNAVFPFQNIKRVIRNIFRTKRIPSFE